MNIERIGQLHGHQDRVWCVAFNHDGSLLASCGGDKTVRLWRRTDQGFVLQQTLEEAHKRTIRSVAFSPSGRHLATASFDATIGIWEKSASGEFELMANLEGHENEVKSVCWSSGGNLLASCSRDKSVWVWEMEADNEFECMGFLQDHTQDVKFVQFHPSENILVSCSYDDTIKVWKEEMDDWFCLQTLTGHTSTVWSASFSPDGRQLATVSDDKTIKIWTCFPPGNTEGVETDGRNGKWMCTQTLVNCHERTIYSVSWSSINALATGASDNSICIFQKAESGEFVGRCKKEKAHTADINCVAWCPRDPTILASCGDDGVINIWKISM